MKRLLLLIVVVMFPAMGIQAQQIDDVNCFSDIARQISNKKCRYTHVISRYGKENTAKVKRIKINCNHFAEQYSRMLDDSGIINYDCDTLYIRDDRWTYVSSKYQFKCNKGLYDVNDKGLTPCDYSFLYSSEVLFESRKNNPKEYEEQREIYDYHPFSYEYEMAPYTLWDNKRLIRNMWEVTDWSQNLIRIIIRDHEIVYFDAWSW